MKQRKENIFCSAHTHVVCYFFSFWLTPHSLRPISTKSTLEHLALWAATMFKRTCIYKTLSGLLTSYETSNSTRAWVLAAKLILGCLGSLPNLLTTC